MDNGNNPPTLQRLLTLLEAGYVIEVQHSRNSGGDFLSLEHPAKRQRVKDKTLHLHDDASVFGMAQRDDGTHLLIERNDDVAFRRLIATTPRPTWWERNNGPFYWVWAWIVVVSILIVGVKLVDFLWDALFGK